MHACMYVVCINVYVPAYNVVGVLLLTLVVFGYISVCLKIMCNDSAELWM